MKMIRYTYICLACIALLVLSFTSSFAQDEVDKGTLKEWKAKKKKMTVEEFMKVMQDHEAMSGERDRLSRQVKTMNKTLSEKEDESLKLKQEIAEIKDPNMTGGGSSSSTTYSNDSSSGSESSDGSGDDYNKGEVYRVQVGAIRDAKLSEFVNHPRFHAETDADGQKKYTIATFRDRERAEQFKSFLLSLGVKDAYWITYIDGKRIDVNSVSKGSTSSNKKTEKKEENVEKEEEESEGDW